MKSSSSWLNYLGNFICWPLLHFDLVRTARKSVIGHRCLFAAFLLASICLSYLSWFATDRVRLRDFFISHSMPAGKMDQFASHLFNSFLWVQWLAVCLLTPIYTASAITEEKQRRTLELLLTTSLSSQEIILTKLVSRLGNMVMILLTGLPILAALQFLGGVDPNQVLSGYGFMVLVMLGLGSIAIYTAVRTARLAEAVFQTYLCAFLLGMPAIILWGITQQLYYLLGQLTLLVMVAILPTVVLLVGAVRQLREKALAPPPRETPIQKELFYPAVLPPVSDQPMLWKETHVEHHRGIRWLGAFAHAVGVVLVAAIALFSFGEGEVARGRGTILGTAIVLAILVASGWLSREREKQALRQFGVVSVESWIRAFAVLMVGVLVVYILSVPLTPGPRAEGANAMVRATGTVLATILMVGAGVAAAGCISRERERHTLDSLLSTPLEAGEILGAKFLGALACIRPASWLLGLLWLVGLVIGGLHALAGPLLVLAFVAYVVFFISLGMWISLQSSSTVRATMLTLIASLLLIAGPWFAGRGLFHFLGLPAQRAEHLGLLQAFALSPSASLAILSFDGSAFEPALRGLGHERYFANYWPAPFLGLMIYGGASWLLWRSMLERLRPQAR